VLSLYGASPNGGLEEDIWLIWNFCITRGTTLLPSLLKSSKVRLTHLVKGSKVRQWVTSGI